MAAKHVEIWNDTTLISLADIFSYASAQKRCVIEGEQVLSNGHIICCGVKNRQASEITIFALCLQTSALQGKPHELSAVFKQGRDKDSGEFDVCCSCIAGKSKKCKHVIALLMLLNKTPVSQLEDLSCTDLSQQWGKLKNSTKSMYEAVPIKSFCHVISHTELYKQKSMEMEETDWQTNCRKALIAIAPNSALALHQKGRTTTMPRLRVTPGTEINVPDELNIYLAIFQFINEKTDQKRTVNPLFFTALPSSDLHMTIKKVSLNNLDKTVKLFYINYVHANVSKCIEICQNTLQQSECVTWQQERKKRITASECYQFYTYQGSDEEWEDKVRKHLAKTFQGNGNTRYGTENEPAALKRYEEVTDHKLIRFGLIINPKFPWLGFSPDGIAFQDNIPHHLVEVKCVVAGQQKSVFELTIPYIICDDEGNFRLLEKHKYYGQIQLSLAICGLEFADLVIYGKCKNDVLIARVDRNDQFIDDLLNKLKWVYFKFLLVRLTEIHNNKNSTRILRM